MVTTRVGGASVFIVMSPAVKWHPCCGRRRGLLKGIHWSLLFSRYRILQYERSKLTSFPLAKKTQKTKCLVLFFRSGYPCICNPEPSRTDCLLNWTVSQNSSSGSAWPEAGSDSHRKEQNSFPVSIKGIPVNAANCSEFSQLPSKVLRNFPLNKMLFTG